MDKLGFRDIAAACERLTAEGSRVTVRAVHALTGGSMRTVHQHYRDWRREQEAAASLQEDPSDGFLASLKAEIAQHVAEARAAADQERDESRLREEEMAELLAAAEIAAEEARQELAAGQAAAQEREQELVAELATWRERAGAQARDLARVTEERDQAAEELARLRVEAGQLEQGRATAEASRAEALERARAAEQAHVRAAEAIARLTERVEIQQRDAEEKDRQLRALAEKLDTVRAEEAQARERAAVAEADARALVRRSEDLQALADERRGALREHAEELRGVRQALDRARAGELDSERRIVAAERALQVAEGEKAAVLARLAALQPPDKVDPGGAPP